MIYILLFIYEYNGWCFEIERIKKKYWSGVLNKGGVQRSYFFIFYHAVL